MEYISIGRNNNLKTLSLEDNLYYTLEDIFINADTSDLCTYAVYFMNELKEGCYYKSKMMNEKYTDCLNNKEFVSSLNDRIIKYLTPNHLQYDKENDEIYEKMDKNKWWKQFEELRKQLKEHYEMLN